MPVLPAKPEALGEAECSDVCELLAAPSSWKFQRKSRPLLPPVRNQVLHSVHHVEERRDTSRPLIFILENIARYLFCFSYTAATFESFSQHQFLGSLNNNQGRCSLRSEIELFPHPTGPSIEIPFCNGDSHVF
ncbi:hypothetical protein GOP47_0009497 [Adiantum capillus-veneris]|uniref:Uncharacterized protein n=1 Tax=Adiantum capillus-veneris TaxID=13818 RepID=A0A9D4UWS4_ADICA|nr:hypothetical protein GOP47_0009497 [Adiantum capillus-veneris]